MGYLILALAALLFGAMVVRYDMHEREPWWMLVLAAGLGALAMWGAFELEDLLESALVDGGPGFAYRPTKSVLAGTIEELAKLAVPVFVLLAMRRHFNDPMDGLIYGSLAGLGAAIFESAWWQSLEHTPMGVGLFESQGQSMVRLLMHTVWGGIDGFALGLIVMKRPWRRSLLRCVGTVMLMHVARDYFIGFAPEQTNAARLLAAGLLSGSIVWYGTLVVRANKWSRSMHAPTSKKRLVGRILRALITRRFR